MERIFIHYELMECWKTSFYSTPNVKARRRHIERVVSLFSCDQKTREYMEMVLYEWPNSAAFHLSNTHINRVAWIGQAACYLYGGTPKTMTMEAWWHVDKPLRDQADMVAMGVICNFENNRVYAKDTIRVKCA